MRWLLRALATIFVLILLLGIMVVLMPKTAVLDLAEQRFETATGRKLELGDNASVSLWPPGVRAGPVRIANAAWAETPDLLVADELVIGLNPVALLDGALHVTEIRIEAPQLLLERAADGRANWTMAPVAAPGAAGAEGAGAEGPDTPAAGHRVMLDRIELRGGTLRFTDHQNGRETRLDAVSISSAIPDLEGPVTARIAAELRGQPLSGDARTDSLAALLSGKPAPLAVTLAAGGNSASFDGTFGSQPLRAEGALRIALPDRAALATLLGAPLPDVPRGLGAESLGLEARLSLAPGGNPRLRDLRLALDDQMLTGQLEWQNGKDRPRVLGQLAARSFEIASPPPGRAGTGQTASAGWSEAPLDASALRALDLDIGFTADSLQRGPWRLAPVEARLVIDNARALLSIPAAGAWGGQLAGQIVVNDRSGLSASTDLTLTGFDITTLLQETAGFARLTGSGDLRLKLLASGATQAAMMRSLRGEAALALGKGEIIGLDIAGMLRTMDPGYIGEGRRTVFDRFSLSAQIEAGIARSEDLVLSSDLVQAGGAGQTDLGAQSLEYRLLPRLIPREDGSGGVEVPVLISGAWASPRVRLDLEWLARERARIETERAEERARQRLEELARDKLEVVPQEGEGLEDAARRRAREALGAEAERTLDRLLGRD